MCGDVNVVFESSEQHFSCALCVTASLAIVL